MNKMNLKSAPLVLALLGAGIVGGAAVEAVHHVGAPATAAVLPPTTTNSLPVQLLPSSPFAQLVTTGEPVPRSSVPS